MIRVLHVIDLHFSHDKEKNNDMLKLTDKIYKAGFGANDYLLITGDIADDGDPDQFKNAVDAVKAFKHRILAAPGVTLQRVPTRSEVSRRGLAVDLRRSFAWRQL